MTNNCLSEGGLRAHLDGEMNTEETAAHVASCAACTVRLSTIRARTEHVAALLSGLGALAPLSQAAPPDRRPRRRKRLGVAVAIAAGAIAAGVALFVLQRPATTPPPVIVKLEPQPSLKPVTSPPPSPSARKSQRHRRPLRHPPGPPDENTIEAGYIVRVALGPQEDPADLIVTPDGRIHAVRFLP